MTDGPDDTAIGADLTGLRPEASMDSAGAELMSLSFDLEATPALAHLAGRVRDIGGWISTGATSDMEKALLRVVGAVVGTMRRRGFAFRDDVPIGAQFQTFLDAIPDAMRGEADHVDQATVEPALRDDVFGAQVDLADVRRWTDAHGRDHAIARRATVRPDNGIPGTATVYATGADAALFTEGASIGTALRRMGGALAMRPQSETRTSPRGEHGAEILTRVRGMAIDLASDRDDLAWFEQLDRPGSATRLASARDLDAVVGMAMRAERRERHGGQDASS